MMPKSHAGKSAGSGEVFVHPDPAKKSSSKADIGKGKKSKKRNKNTWRENKNINESRERPEKEKAAKKARQRSDYRSQYPLANDEALKKLGPDHADKIFGDGTPVSLLQKRKASGPSGTSSAKKTRVALDLAKQGDIEEVSDSTSDDSSDDSSDSDDSDDSGDSEKGQTADSAYRPDIDEISKDEEVEEVSELQDFQQADETERSEAAINSPAVRDLRKNVKKVLQDNMEKSLQSKSILALINQAAAKAAKAQAIETSREQAALALKPIQDQLTQYAQNFNAMMEAQRFAFEKMEYALKNAKRIVAEVKLDESKLAPALQEIQDMEDLSEANKTFLSELMKKNMLLQVETKAAIDEQAIITMHEQINFGQKELLLSQEKANQAIASAQQLALAGSN